MRNAEFKQPETVGARTRSAGSAWMGIHGLNRWTANCMEMYEKCGVQAARNGQGSNAGHSPGAAGVDARRATPPDPRLARWGLASCCQLDPSHPALVTRQDPGVEPCRFFLICLLAPCGTGAPAFGRPGRVVGPQHPPPHVPCRWPEMGSFYLLDPAFVRSKSQYAKD